MKLLVGLFLSLTLYMTVAIAKQQSDNVSVKQLIQKVKSSTGDDRRVAMNALKGKLRSMNQETRRQVMLDLQKSFSGKQHTMQRGMQQNGQAKETMYSGNSKGMHTSGERHTSPSQTPSPSHTSPSAVPHQPTPSVPQTPRIHPSSPQGPSHNVPVPHFSQPGGHK